MNSVIISGRVVRQIVLRYTKAGTAVATGTMAVNRPYKKDAEVQEADFINFVIWGKIAESTAARVGKGDRLQIRGRMQTRAWSDQEQQRHYITEVIADQVEWIDYKKQQDPTTTPPLQGKEPERLEDLGAQQPAFTEEIPF